MSFQTVTLMLFEGFAENGLIFIMTLVFALPLGLVLTFGSMSSFLPLKWLTKTFVWIIRGTPLMLQLFVVMYVPGLLFGIRMPSSLFGIQVSPRMFSALIAFVINYAAYFSEIYRGGIESISVGQYEAGQVLGMTKSQIFFKVVLMQVVKRIIPPMGNEIITLVKDTSLARVIAVQEILWIAEESTSSRSAVYSHCCSVGLKRSLAIIEVEFETSSNSFRISAIFSPLARQPKIMHIMTIPFVVVLWLSNTRGMVINSYIRCTKHKKELWRHRGAEGCRLCPGKG